MRARKKADMLVKLRALQSQKDQGIDNQGSLIITTTEAWIDYWLSQVARRVI